MENNREGDVVGRWEDLGVGVCCYERQVALSGQEDLDTDSHLSRLCAIAK
jgi:hypothetical protein